MFYFVVVIGLISAYLGGMHDGGTVVATAISSRLLTPKKAVILAGCANFLGSICLGTAVAYTISSGIVDVSPMLKENPRTVLFFAASAFLGAVTWNLMTWVKKLPSSSSHSLIGAMIGSGIAAGGIGCIQWPTIIQKIILAMFISPVIGFSFGFLFMKLEKKLLQYGTMVWSRRINRTGKLSSFLLAFCYGSNDSQKAMGLISIGIAAFRGLDGTGPENFQIPLWLILAASLSLSLGTMTGGYNMIKTVGMDICKINNRSAFASQISSVFVIITANLTGLPISSTQVVTGSVMGVGTENAPRSVNWSVTGKIVTAWLSTIPVSAAFGGFVYMLLHFIGKL